MNTFFEDTNTPANETETELDVISGGEVIESGNGDRSESMSGFLDFLARMGADLPSISNIIADDDDEDSDDDDDNEAEIEGNMDADDYHNKACDYARRGSTKQAAEVCLKGLKYFPMNVDLLADTIKYSSDSGDMKTAAKHYAILKKSIPFSRWNWRAYTFSIDYLLGENPAANEAECRQLVENYKKFIPHEEKSCMAESELEMSIGNSGRSMEVLVNAIATRSNASQCALRLADMQMDRGMYEAVVDTANYGIAASAEAQPSINVTYLYYLRALAKDHLIHKKEYAHEAISSEEVRIMEKEYDLLLEKFPRQMVRFASNIKLRSDMLAFIQTTD